MLLGLVVARTLASVVPSQLMVRSSRRLALVRTKLASRASGSPVGRPRAIAGARSPGASWARAGASGSGVGSGMGYCG